MSGRKFTDNLVKKDDANIYIMGGIVLGISMAGAVMAMASLIVLVVFK